MDTGPGMDLATAVRLRPDPRPFDGGTPDRGVVVAGGGPYLPSAYVLVRHLRRAGCTLPVQVWCLDATELTPEWDDLVRGLGVTTHHAVTVMADYEVAGGYECKVAALMNCPFRHVLLLDADNVPVVDPTYLFDTPEYRDHGQIFWPDQPCGPDNRCAIREPTWGDFDIQRRVGAELETGQLMVDRQACWPELQVVEMLNQRSRECYAKYTYGDKDTPVIAWEVTGRPYYVVPHRPAYAAHLLWQYGPDGRLVFQHQRKFTRGPAEMLASMPLAERHRQASVTYLNDYYRVVPWRGPLHVPPFRPPR